tara:strand:- start:325 stop:678 length:354 start_codon:yes stop_codon:yes gene_type:complete
MSDYTLQVSWSGKDDLADSNAAKVISGDEFNTEFSAVRTAVNSKCDQTDNLSDLNNAATARTNLGLGTGNSPQFTSIELGHASDTTLARSASGIVTIEGSIVKTAASLTGKELVFGF